MRVLELGCGHGLPGVACLLKQAKEVVFQDLNRDVLRTMTLAAVALNLPVDVADTTQCAQRRRGTRFVAGDWNVLLKNLDALSLRSFDLVLAAETIYSTESLTPFVAMLRNAMAQPHGAALVSAKLYYFGNNGFLWFIDNNE